MNEKPKELDVVALTADMPAKGLRRGQVGAIVAILEGGVAYEVEFCNAQGQTYALETLQHDEFMVLRYELERAATS